MAKLTPYQQDALEYGKHIALTANAGSGKTFVLSKRYVDIALKENIPLRKIIAITFTDKAAGELNKKIAQEVEERLNSDLYKNEIKILERIRRQLVSANISTIHSFCIEVLKEFSPEAGLDANFTPIDQTSADELIDLSIEETLNHFLLNESEVDVKGLIRFFGSKKILSAELKRMIKNRKPVLELEEKLYNKDEVLIAEEFRAIFEKYFRKIFAGQISDIKYLLKNINQTALLVKPDNELAAGAAEIIDAIDDELDTDKLLEKFASIYDLIFTTKGEIRSRGYLPKSEKESLSEEIAEVEKFFGEISKFTFPEDPEIVEQNLASFGKKIISLFRIIDDDYTNQKDQRGYLDFEDILVHTKRIINFPEVQKYLSSNYKFVMIDEYQDTNEIQYQIFMPILDNLKSGNLFVVGDEKQSIYMFRDADIKVFLRTKNEIAAAVNKDSILSLPHSFRVSPPIAAFTNKLFEELFKDPDFELNEVEHSSLVCAKPPDTEGSIEFIISDGEGDAEADLVAKKILSMIDDKNIDCSLSDFCILCRKRSAFAELEKSFSHYGIPHTVVAGKGFYQKQIVSDIYNYLSFLTNQEDDTALVGILRSPFFTVSDKTIFEISLERGKSFFSKLSYMAETDSRLASILSTLKQHIIYAKRSEFSSILRKIISDTNYLSVLAARESYKQELSNLEKLFSIAKSFEQQGFKTLFDLVDYLKTSIQQLVDEGQAVINDEEESVKIMTIHQSKGLEFNSVFLYRCSDRSEQSSVKSRSLAIDKDFGILTKVPDSENYFEDFISAPVNNIYNYVTHRKNVAEIKRLLYVGVTRAVENLFITAKTKNGRMENDSFLKLICEGLNIDAESIDYDVKTNLEFMELKGEKFEFYKLPIEFKIPITKEIDYEMNNNIQHNEIDEPEKIYHLEKIEDEPEQEIVSATKLAVYTQCPLKYQLTYELGYSDINNLFNTSGGSVREEYQHEFNLNEDEEFIGYSDVRGSIIHKILDEGIQELGLAQRIQIMLSKEFNNKGVAENTRQQLMVSIMNHLHKFYASQTFKDLCAYKNFKNEHEIYLKLNDYYLYGIIDKLVFDEEKIIIIDYKTDNIKEDQIDNRGELYLSQLKFYSVLVSEVYKNKNIELRIIFTKYPKAKFVKAVSDEEILEFRNHIHNVVTSIRESNYPPNLNHCKKCHYSIDGKKCIKNFHKTSA